ncbi:hypothetical protein Tco_0690791 [Tanacetum coccineum]
MPQLLRVPIHFDYAFAFSIFTLDGEAEIGLEKEPPRSIITWDDLILQQVANFWDSKCSEGLALWSKSKVRYSRSRANAFTSEYGLSFFTNSSPSNNSFDMQQIAASLEDKMTIKMNQMMNQMKALVVTPAPVKAVEEVCVTCGSNHNFNHCPLTRGGNDFPVFQDNIQQFQQTAAIALLQIQELSSQTVKLTLVSKLMLSPQERLKLWIRNLLNPLVPTPDVSILNKES